MKNQELLDQILLELTNLLPAHLMLIFPTLSILRYKLKRKWPIKKKSNGHWKEFILKCNKFQNAKDEIVIAQWNEGKIKVTF